MVCKKLTVASLILFLGACQLFALDLNIRPSGDVAIPIGTASTPFYSVGFGGTLNGDIELFNLFAVGPELDYW